MSMAISQFIATCIGLRGAISTTNNYEAIMMKNTFYKSSVGVICLIALLVGCASTDSPQEATSTVKASEVTLSEFLRDPEMKWLQENMPNAKAVLISPKILKAGFVVGGSGGEAIVITRSNTPSGWSSPAFYTMTSGSFGFQAGAQSSEVVALVMTDKAMNTLMSSSFKLGGDMSVAAGPVGAGVGTGVSADMVVFSRSKGLYGGINLDGTAITVDDKGNQAFYGRPVTPVDILVKGTATSPEGATLARIASTGTSTGK